MRLRVRRPVPRPREAQSRPVVAVTGAAGRVGQACLRALESERVDVIAIDRVRGDGPGEWRRADLRRSADAERGLAGATHLIHLAGITFPDPESEVLMENVGIAANVLRAFASGAPQTAVLASSTSTYGLVWSPSLVSPDYVPVDEDHPCRPADPYSLSKVVLEQLAAMWTRSAGFTTLALRFPWTSADEPERVRSFLDLIAADPTGELGRRHLWAYAHVDDVARAMVSALTVQDGRAHVLNIAAADIPGGYRASELVATCHPQAQVRADVDKVGLFATDRAYELLGWRPVHPRPASDSWAASAASTESG